MNRFIIYHDYTDGSDAFLIETDLTGDEIQGLRRKNEIAFAEWLGINDHDIDREYIHVYDVLVVNELKGDDLREKIVTANLID